MSNLHSELITLPALELRKIAELARLETELRLRDSRSWRMGRALSLLLLLPRLVIDPRRTALEIRNRWREACAGAAVELRQRALALRREVEAIRRPNRVEIAAYAPPVEIEAGFLRQPKLTALAVLDDFSAHALAPDLHLIALAPHESIDAHLERKPDFLLVESAWHGSGGRWGNELLHADRVAGEALRNLVSACRKRQIPTVFWNKEDPTSFEGFRKAAELFDFVFTTDEACVERYRGHGCTRVGVLPFFAQPLYHNPVLATGTDRDRDVLFAGSWYGDRYPERRDELQKLLRAAGPRLEIFDRRYNDFLDPQAQFPADLESHVVGTLSAEQMLTAYRRYRVVLNVNTVRDSRTMLSRRVFEASASGAAVISTPSPALTNFFGDTVIPADGDSQKLSQAIAHLLADPVQRATLVQRALVKVYREHTAAHRIAQLASEVLARPLPASPELSSHGVIMNALRLECVALTTDQSKVFRIARVSPTDALSFAQGRLASAAELAAARLRPLLHLPQIFA